MVELSAKFLLYGKSLADWLRSTISSQKTIRTTNMANESASPFQLSMNDEFSLDLDSCGREEFAQSFAEIIKKCKLPYAIGVSGGWGSGKTSFLKYVYGYLGGVPSTFRLQNRNEAIFSSFEVDEFYRVFYDKDNKEVEGNKKQCLCLWYSPWENEGVKEPLISFLQHLRSFTESLLYQSDQSDSAPTTLATKAKKIYAKNKHLRPAALQTTLDIIDGISSFIPGINTHFGEHAEKFTKNAAKARIADFQNPQRNQLIKIKFEEAVNQLLMGQFGEGFDKNTNTDEQSKRLIFFIDDLDRCDPITAAKLLQSIKQCFATPNCVFVFGFDRVHLERSLSMAMDSSAQESRNYLEKIFQKTCILPPIDYKKFHESLRKNEKTREGWHKIFAEWGLLEEDLGKLESNIMLFLDRNPRRIKLFWEEYLRVVRLKGIDVAEDVKNIFAQVAKEKIDSLINSDNSRDGGSREGDRVTLQNFEVYNNIIAYYLEQLALITYLKVFFENVYSVLENQPELLQDFVRINDDAEPQTNNNRRFFVFEMASVLTKGTGESVSYDKMDLDSQTRALDFIGRHREHQNFIDRSKQLFSFPGITPESEKDSASSAPPSVAPIAIVGLYGENNWNIDLFRKAYF